MNKKRISLMYFGILLFVCIIGGISFAFFNYTKTGTANVIRTGNIVFNAVQGTGFDLTNMFPIEATSSNLADTTKVGTLTIHVTGSTDYNKGIEYLVSTSEVVNSIGRRTIPVSIDIDYSSVDEDSEIGTLDYEYFDNHGKNESIYRPLTRRVLKDNERLLVGYIAPSEEGIDGTITIKAYLDKDVVGVSDTYRGNLYNYIFNNNMTDEEYNNCVNYYDNTFIDSTGYGSLICKGEESVFFHGISRSVNNYLSFINSPKPTGMSDEDYNAWCEWYLEIIDDLLEMNVIKEVAYQNGTTGDWAGQRTILTTNEWNSLNDIGISFKIKIEAREDIWVESEYPTMSEMCPNCEFGYPTSSLYSTWNTTGKTPSIVTSGFTNDYRNFVSSTGKRVFSGIIKNENNQITRSFVCGMVYDDPVCLEVAADGTLTNVSKERLNQFIDADFCGTIYSNTYGYYYACSLDSVYFRIYDYGYVDISNINDDLCYVDVTGEIWCDS